MRLKLFSLFKQKEDTPAVSQEKSDCPESPDCYHCEYLSPGPAGGLPMCDIHGLWIHDFEAERACDCFKAKK